MNNTAEIASQPIGQMNKWRTNLATLGATAVALLGANTIASPASAEAECVTHHTIETITNADGSTTTVDSTNTVCTPDNPTQPPSPPATKPPKTEEPHGTKPPKHHHTVKQPKAPEPITFKRHYSYDMCGGWGGRICTSGCGDVVSADFASDLTGRRITPLDVLPILSPQYYIPGAGTRPEGFKLIARHYGLHEKAGNLSSAAKTISKLGGVAIAEFNNGVAVERSGHSSPITLADHYVLLDRYKNGKFAMADPHQGADRHNERSRSGQIRYWTAKQLKQAGLINVWTVTP